MTSILYLALLTCQATTPITVLYRDPKNDLELLNCTAVHGLHGDSANLQFDLKGAPLTLKLNSAGLAVRCKRLDGSVTDLDKPRSVIRSLNATGNSSFHVDTAARERYEIDHKMLTAPSPDQSVTDITSDKFNYAGSATEGTLTVPAAVHIVGKQSGPGAKGSKVERYINDMDLTGSSAVLTINPSATSNQTALRRGKLHGPVALKWIRHETPVSGDPTESTLDGTADSMTMDLVSATKTITLDGHVHVKASGGLKIGEANVNRMVITLDDQLQPIDFDADGDSTTRIHVGETGS